MFQIIFASLHPVYLFLQSSTSSQSHLCHLPQKMFASSHPLYLRICVFVYLYLRISPKLCRVSCVTCLSKCLSRLLRVYLCICVFVFVYVLSVYFSKVVQYRVSCVTCLSKCLSGLLRVSTNSVLCPPSQCGQHPNNQYTLFIEEAFKMRCVCVFMQLGLLTQPDVRQRWNTRCRPHSLICSALATLHFYVFSYASHNHT